MRIRVLEAEDARARLEWAAFGLARNHAELSAARPVDRGQRRILVGLMFASLAALVLAPLGTMLVFVLLATAGYVAGVLYRVLLFHRSLRSTSVIVVSDEEARAVADVDLPTYTVLVPAYREPAVVGGLLV